jgi:hypothetical protein
LKDIVDKTETILIAFNGTLLFFGLWRWQFMNRNLIVPLDHTIHPFYSLDVSIKHITRGAVNKSEILISKS